MFRIIDVTDKFELQKTVILIFVSATILFSRQSFDYTINCLNIVSDFSAYRSNTIILSFEFHINMLQLNRF